MKTYEVELKYTSFTTFTIEAETEEQAEELAFKEAEMSKPWGSWDIESTEEIKETQNVSTT